MSLTSEETVIGLGGTQIVNPSPTEHYSERRPFDYFSPTNQELEPFLGKKWVIGRNTPGLRARYPNSNIVSPKAYEKAEAAAIEARGYARPAEKVILDLVEYVLRDAESHKLCRHTRDGQFLSGAKAAETFPCIVAARAVLAKARNP